MQTLHVLCSTGALRRGTDLMRRFKLAGAPSRLLARFREWQADMTLHHRWFRILLHLGGMVRRPLNAAWHWQHILNEFYGAHR